MAGADTILRVIGAALFLMVLAFVTAVGFAVMDPIYANVGSAPASLGWGSIKDTVMNWAAIGLVGLGIVVIVWMWVSPIRDDVRQDVNQRGPF